MFLKNTSISTFNYWLASGNLTGAKRREFSGMIHWLTINNNLSNPYSHPFPT